MSRDPGRTHRASGYRSTAGARTTLRQQQGGRDRGRDMPREGRTDRDKKKPRRYYGDSDFEMMEPKNRARLARRDDATGWCGGWAHGGQQSFREERSQQRKKLSYRRSRSGGSSSRDPEKRHARASKAEATRPGRERERAKDRQRDHERESREVQWGVRGRTGEGNSRQSVAGSKRGRSVGVEDQCRENRPSAVVAAFAEQSARGSFAFSSRSHRKKSSSKKRRRSGSRSDMDTRDHSVASLSSLPGDRMTELERPMAKSPPRRSQRGGSLSDDDENNAIVHARYEIGARFGPGRRYKVISLLGDGTFGRVLKCQDCKTDTSSLPTSLNRRRRPVVAVKIIRDVSRYKRNAEEEMDILREVAEADHKNESGCLRLLDSFEYGSRRQHLCLVTNILGKSVYDIIHANNYRGFYYKDIQKMLVSVLKAVAFCHDRLGLTHTDLKPENILFVSTHSKYTRVPDRMAPSSGRKPPRYERPCGTEMQLIDFGNATFADDRKSTIINTRQYRGPEIILGAGTGPLETDKQPHNSRAVPRGDKWDTTSDIWSVACIAAEMYTGEMLLPAHDNLEHLAMMERLLGPLPQSLLQRYQEVEEEPTPLVVWDPVASRLRLNFPEGARSKRHIDSVRRVRRLGSIFRYNDSDNPPGGYYMPPAGELGHGFQPQQQQQQGYWNRRSEPYPSSTPPRAAAEFSREYRGNTAPPLGGQRRTGLFGWVSSVKNKISSMFFSDETQEEGPDSQQRQQQVADQPFVRHPHFQRDEQRPHDWHRRHAVVPPEPAYYGPTSNRMHREDDFYGEPVDFHGYEPEWRPPTEQHRIAAPPPIFSFPPPQRNPAVTRRLQYEDIGPVGAGGRFFPREQFIAGSRWIGRPDFMDELRLPNAKRPNSPAKYAGMIPAGFRREANDNLLRRNAVDSYEQQPQDTRGSRFRIDGNGGGGHTSRERERASLGTARDDRQEYPGSDYGDVPTYEPPQYHHHAAVDGVASGDRGSKNRQSLFSDELSDGGRPTSNWTHPRQQQQPLPMQRTAKGTGSGHRGVLDSGHPDESIGGSDHIRYPQPSSSPAPEELGFGGLKPSSPAGGTRERAWGGGGGPVSIQRLRCQPGQFEDAPRETMPTPGHSQRLSQQIWSEQEQGSMQKRSSESPSEQEGPCRSSVKRTHAAAIGQPQLQQRSDLKQVTLQQMKQATHQRLMTLREKLCTLKPHELARGGAVLQRNDLRSRVAQGLRSLAAEKDSQKVSRNPVHAATTTIAQEKGQLPAAVPPSQPQVSLQDPAPTDRLKLGGEAAAVGAFGGAGIASNEVKGQKQDLLSQNAQVSSGGPGTTSQGFGQDKDISKAVPVQPSVFAGTPQTSSSGGLVFGATDKTQNSNSQPPTSNLFGQAAAANAGEATDAHLTAGAAAAGSDAKTTTNVAIEVANETQSSSSSPPAEKPALVLPTATTAAAPASSSSQSQPAVFQFGTEPVNWDDYAESDGFASNARDSDSEEEPAATQPGGGKRARAAGDDEETSADKAKGSIFGGPFGGAAAAAGGSIFGNIGTAPSASAGGSGIFASLGSNSIFGNIASSSTSTGGLFSATSSSSSSGGLFNVKTESASGGDLFGRSTTSSSTSGGGLFGSGTASSSSTGAAATSNIFAMASSSTSSSIFGSSVDHSSGSSAPVGGGLLAKQQEHNPLFASVGSQSSSGGTTGVFATTSSFTTGSVFAQQPTEIQQHTSEMLDQSMNLAGATPQRPTSNSVFGNTGGGGGLFGSSASNTGGGGSIFGSGNPFSSGGSAAASFPNAFSENPSCNSMSGGGSIFGQQQPQQHQASFGSTAASASVFGATASGGNPFQSGFGGGAGGGDSGGGAGLFGSAGGQAGTSTNAGGSLFSAPQGPQGNGGGAFGAQQGNQGGGGGMGGGGGGGMFGGAGFRPQGGAAGPPGRRILTARRRG